jgi:hypothetical protein
MVIDAKLVCERDRAWKLNECALEAEAMTAISMAADLRDSVAEKRDREADRREGAASLRSFLDDRPVSDHDHDHADGLPARRAAAMDRIDAKIDRAAAAADRARLSAYLTQG